MNLPFGLRWMQIWVNPIIYFAVELGKYLKSKCHVFSQNDKSKLECAYSNIKATKLIGSVSAMDIKIILF